MTPTSGISPNYHLPTPQLPETTGKVDAGEFKNLLIESIDHVNSMQMDADHAVEQLVTGGDANMVEVLTAVQKADMSFRLMLQIRNKLMQAYQEIQNIRI